MKKIYLVSAIFTIFGLLFADKPEWFMFMWGWQILLLPLIAGIFMVLVQNEDRSYRFVPKLIIGSLLTGFIFPFLWQLIASDQSNHFFFKATFSLTLFLSGVCFFGGLIGIVVKGTFLLFEKKFGSKFHLIFKKIFGIMFLSISVIGALTSIVVFLVLFFNPRGSLINRFMVDFKVIDIIGAVKYYILLLSDLFIVLIPATFVFILGLGLFFTGKNFFNLKRFLLLILLFFLSLAVFFPLSSDMESKFQEKKGEMKERQAEKHFDIKDFDSIYVSRFVKFDEITIKQGDQFDIVASGSEYDLIGLDFEKFGNNTLMIKRSELETYYNTKTWTMENDNIQFAAGTKYLSIEITMPNVKKIESEGGHIELVDFNVDNIEIRLNKRFNNIKGNITVKDTLKLDARGGIINLSGSAGNLVINSGDCWIEMDNLVTQRAVINAKNTSRLNVNVSGDMKILSEDDSSIVNYYEEE